MKDNTKNNNEEATTFTCKICKEEYPDTTASNCGGDCVFCMAEAGDPECIKNCIALGRDKGKVALGAKNLADTARAFIAKSEAIRMASQQICRLYYDTAVEVVGEDEVDRQMQARVEEHAKKKGVPVPEFATAKHPTGYYVPAGSEESFLKPEDDPGESLPAEMEHNPGKYDELCTHVRMESKAAGAAVIVMGGIKGYGFSVQAPPHIVERMPEMLRHIAANIEKEEGGAK